MKTILSQRSQAAVARTAPGAWKGCGAGGVNWVVALLVLVTAAATVCGFAALVDTVQSWAVVQAGAGPLLP